MDKLQKIRAEVERRRKIVKNSALQMKDAEKRNHYLKMVEEYDDILRYIDSSPSEPVSEDLEEAAKHYLYSNILYDDVYVGNPTDKDCIEMFKAGANWQKEQFEKNRLKHCNSITNEQAELEQGFLDQHLDKHQRMPTFLDAIEYGMRLQKEQMMAKAIDAKACAVYPLKTCNEVHYSVQYPIGVLPQKDGDKVKVIVIKED